MLWSFSSTGGGGGFSDGLWFSFACEKSKKSFLYVYIILNYNSHMVEEFSLFITIFIKCALCRIQLESVHCAGYNWKYVISNGLLWTTLLSGR